MPTGGMNRPQPIPVIDASLPRLELPARLTKHGIPILQELSEPQLELLALMLLAEDHLVDKLVGALLHLPRHLSTARLLYLVLEIGDFDAFQGVVLVAFRGSPIVDRVILPRLG